MRPSPESLEARLLLDADLNWASGLILPAAVDVGTPFTVGRSYRVSSQDLTSDFVIGYYRSTDPIIGNGDDALLGSETVGAAADKGVGAHTGTSPGLTLPGTGTYYLFARLDVANAVAESDEINNACEAAPVVAASLPSRWSVVASNANPLHNPRNNSDIGRTYRTRHLAAADTPALRLVYANYYGNTLGEDPNTNPIMVKATVEKLDGTVYPVTFRGGRTVTIAGGMTLFPTRSPSR